MALKRVESRIEYFSVYVKYSMGVLYTIPGSNILVSQTFHSLIARLQFYIFYPVSCELNFWAIFFLLKGVMDVFRGILENSVRHLGI